MDRPYPTYSPGTPVTHRPPVYTDPQTDVIEDFTGYPGEYDYSEDDQYDYPDDIVEYEDPIDRRWIWVAGVAGVILLIAVICTVVILGGGDSGSVSKTVAPPTATTGQSPTATATSPRFAPPASPSSLPPSAPLSPETVTTVAPEPAAPAPTEVAPAPRSVTYQITGTRQLLDLVTVIYTDQQGALQTDVNVALPWSRTVTLDPGVQLSSVTATSMGGQLSCSITDSTGATLAAQTGNTLIATCTK